jgi:hypothetical protein
MPSGGRRASAAMMNAEKAKKRPAISPQPSAESKVKAKSRPVIICDFRRRLCTCSLDKS